ncbi:MAG TPA: hypothetical protein P5509_06470 [Bacteroidales bacterium]|nr:hypothetical protein [Bacteroidales bacterium]
MKIAKEEKKYIYCLEGDWSNDLRDRTSIKSTLDYLKDCFNIDYIRRDCATKEALFDYLKKYTLKKYNKYSILYLAFHGEANAIQVGKEIVELGEIAEICEDKLKYCIVHFGSCSTLNLNKRIINQFIQKTNALCVSGYKTDVDFNKSTVLDVLYFEEWQKYKDVRSVERNMKQYKGLHNVLGFRIEHV